MASKRGMIIVLEGIDRVGKSTQASKLIDLLKKEGHRVEMIRFPDRSTTIGKLINEYLSGQTKLSDQVIHLLFSANRWEKFDQMVDLVNSGTSLVIDRYAYSGVAYSTAKGLDFEWCKSSDTKLLKPDCIFFLTADVDALNNRTNYGQEIYENIDFQRKVKDAYLKLKSSNWSIIDTENKSIEDVHEEIATIVKKTRETLSENPNYLW